MSKNLSSLSGRKGLEENLFEKISELSRSPEKLSREELGLLAEEYLMGTANLFGTATFYDFTKPENQGKKAYVCNGSSCLLAGTQDRVRRALEEEFEPEEIGEMCCLGRCYSNSAFNYKGHNYSGVHIRNFEDIDSCRYNFSPKYACGHIGRAIFPKQIIANDIIRKFVKQLIASEPEMLLEEVERSGLRGRGGAGFPIAIKMKTCKEAEGERKFIVCNADEGDPGSFSDRHLLEQNPRDVIYGMMMAGYITGASHGVIYLRAEYPESIKEVEWQIRNLTDIGLLGKNLLGSDFSFELKLIKAQGAYICGEETALLASIEGQRPEVRVRPPFPAQEGLFRQPTLVNNVETLANLTYILLYGGTNFASLGTSKSTGTKLLSLDSAFKKPGVYEVEMGTPLYDVIQNLGQGFSRPTKALHIGGPLGGIVPISRIRNLTVDFESFAENGFLLGHGSIIGIPEDFPMIKYLEHLFEFTAHESCGKCFPCRLGSKRGKELCAGASDKNEPIDRTLFDDLLYTLEKGSLCGLGGGIPLPVKNALHYFEDELAPYFKTEKMS